MAMSVNGETVYVPAQKYELIQGLKRMGVFKVAGVPLANATRKELQCEYRRVRKACVQRAQRCDPCPGQYTQMPLLGTP